MVTGETNRRVKWAKVKNCITSRAGKNVKPTGQESIRAIITSVSFKMARRIVHRLEIGKLVD